MRHDIALALVVAGTVICVAACIGGLATSVAYDRVHFLAPMTSLGTPLLAVGLALQDGVNLTSGEILFIAALLALVGPALTAATGRLVAQAEGRLNVDQKAEREL